MTAFIIFCNDRNGTIEEAFVLVAEVVEPARSASSFGGDEISCVAIGGENHVAGSIELGGILVACTVVEKISDGFYSCLGTIVDGSGEIVECMHHGIVDGSDVVEELAGDLH